MMYSQIDHSQTKTRAHETEMNREAHDYVDIDQVVDKVMQGVPEMCTYVVMFLWDEMKHGCIFLGQPVY